MATRIFVAQLRPQNVNRLSLVRFACDNGDGDAPLVGSSKCDANSDCHCYRLRIDICIELTRRQVERLDLIKHLIGKRILSY